MMNTLMNYYLQNTLKITFALILVLSISHATNITNLPTSNNSPTIKQVEPLNPVGEWRAQYVHPIEWPPNIKIVDQQYECILTNGMNDEIKLGGQTIEKMISGATYCITTKSEGAAGSTYTTYTYKTALLEKTSIHSTARPDGNADRTIVVTFILRAVQCLNYDDPQKTECLDERQNLDIDSIISNRIKNVERN